MSISIDNHHEECDGSECATWDCASLPVNIGEFREGQVIEVRDGGRAVVIEWTDGTRSTLEKRPTPAVAVWIESIRKDGKCKDRMCACQTLNLEEQQ